MIRRRHFLPRRAPVVALALLLAVQQSPVAPVQAGATKGAFTEATSLNDPPEPMALSSVSVANFLVDSSGWSPDDISLEMSIQGVSRAALRFDLSELPAGAQVAQATLELTKILPSESVVVGVLDLHVITADWSESSLTSEVTYSATPRASHEPDSNPQSPMTWEVTTLVSDWVSGSVLNRGLLIKWADEGGTSELKAVGTGGDPEFAPRLTVVFSDSDPNADEDVDGLPDGLEILLGGSPNSTDTDGDGLSDSFEATWGGQEHLMDRADSDADSTPDGLEDIDSDSVNALAEQAAGSDPLASDTDRDGTPDGAELAAGTDPTKADTDDDGSDDSAEAVVGTNPLDPDTDDDGVLDGDESFTTEVEGGQGVEVQVTGSASVAASVEVTSLEGMPGLSDGIGQVGPAWEITLSESLTPEFSEAQITLPYDPTNAGQESDLRIFTIDPLTDLWVPAAVDADQTVDATANTVTADVSHFSVFAVFNITNWRALWSAVNQFCLAPPTGGGDDQIFIDLMFVLDSSGSMVWNDPQNLRKQASKTFVDALLSDDRAGVVDFDGGAILRSGLTNDFVSVKAAIDLIDSSGGTNIGVGVDAALDEFDAVGQDPERGRVMILLTDGDGSYNNALTTRASQSLVTIYTVGLGASVNTSLLTSIATGTGGQYFPVDDAGDLPEVFREIGGEIDDGTDTDGDGLTDCEEVRGMPDRFGIEFFSNPQVEDTDADEVPDGVEVGEKWDYSSISIGGVSLADVLGIDYSYGVLSDPRVANTDVDPENPVDVRIDDADEFSFGTNARRVDSDFDGLDDVTELISGLDPNSRDTDDDGLTDLEELVPADPNQGSDPAVYDEYRTPEEFTRLYRDGFICGAFEHDCPLGQYVLWEGGPRAYETFPFALGMVVSSFGGLPADIRDVLASVYHLDAIGTVLGLVGVIPIPVLPESGEVAAKVVKAASKLPASRLPNFIRGIHYLPIPASLRDDMINALLGTELQALADAGLTAAGKKRLIESATDFKALKKAIDGAAQRNLPTSEFMNGFRRGEDVVRHGYNPNTPNADLLGTGLNYNFIAKGKGFADPAVNGPKRWRIVDGWEELLRLARESKVGYQCPRPGCVDKIVTQIMKDKRLLNSGAFDSAEWHFFASHASGTIGADPRIIDALNSTIDEFGNAVPAIPYYVHLP